MKKYDLFTIIKPNLDNDEADKVVVKIEEAVKSLGGEVFSSDKVGRKKLAYEVAGFTDGFIVSQLISVPADKIVELKRQLRLNDSFNVYYKGMCIMTLAKAFVTGTVVRAPEKRFTQNDMAVMGMTVNIDKNNETLLRVIAFGQLAENTANGVQLGDEVAVEGRLQVNTFKLPNGKDKKVFEINASTIEKTSATSGQSNPIMQDNTASQNIVTFSEPDVQQAEIAQDLIDEDEIPF